MGSAGYIEPSDDAPMIGVPRVDEPGTEPHIYPWKPWNIRHIGSGDDEAFHCVPLDDKKPHIYSHACECTITDCGDRYTKGGRLLPLFIHASWDWRELDEKSYFALHGPEEDNELAEEI